MSTRATAPRELQPKEFFFSPENLKKAKAIIAKYPAGKQASAVMPLLDIAQRQQEGNWVSTAAMNTIADMLQMPYIKVYEVATFIPCIILRLWVNICCRCAVQRLAGCAVQMKSLMLFVII
jgi:NADH:ubiquinone oxidoreductase subunit E